MNPERKRSISIEDLLRIKRAERPPAEFWTEFDRQLRAKQLAALVARRPWWQSVPQIFAGFSRYRIPLGATAVIVVAFVSVRTYQNAPTQAGEAAGAKAEPVAVVVSPPSPTSIQSDVSTGKTVEPVLLERRGADVMSAAESAAVSMTADSASATLPQASAVVALLGANAGLATKSAGDSTRYVGSGLAIVQSDSSVLARGLLEPVRAFESHTPSARAAIEPLQQITPPNERSRAKLLTAMLSMTSTEAPARPAERAASKLSEERLYDQIHRFGARGAGVTMKF